MTRPPEFQRLMDEYLGCLRRGKVAACAALYTEDGSIYSFDNPQPARGRSEIEALHRAWLEAGEINQELTILEARADQETGYCLAAWAGDFPQADGAYETFSGKVLTILKRGSGGEWRFHLSSLFADQGPGAT